jgi:hypothetical protein
MAKLKTFAVYVLAVTLAVPGCATVPGGDGKPTFGSPEACVATYTGLGALGGALLGNLIGRDTQSTVAGAAVAGVVAFAAAWGHCFKKFSTAQSREVKGYEETAKQVRYSPRQGSVVKISDYRIDPTAIAPGGTVKFKANYHVMTPGSRDVDVTETRILKVFDPNKRQYVEIGQVPEKTVIARGSTRNTDGSFPIPSNAQEGRFMLAFKVDAAGQSDIEEIPFEITRDNRVLAKARDESLQRVATEPVRAAAQPQTIRAAAATEGEKAIRASGKLLQIVQDKVNLRAQPDTKAELVAVALKNEKYPLLETRELGDRMWHRIRLDDGKTVWLMGAATRLLED